MNKLLNSLLVWLLPGLLLAQPVNNYIKDVVMPSPTAVSLGKFGDIPVSYNTGVPSVGIPIHTLSSGPLKLPVSLAYHAGGMKVGEPVSWVGLGWSLQAGGMISRTVQGKADEDPNGYMLIGQNTAVDAAGCISGSNTNQEFSNGIKDAEPDIFSFSVGGYSGKFFIEADLTNDNVVNGKVVLIPKQDIRIEYTATTGGAYNLKGFVITLPDGTRYEYGLLAGETDVTLGTEITTLNGNANYLNVSGWYLRRLVSADRQYNINLTYTPEAYQYDYRVSNGSSGYQTRNIYQVNTVTINGRRLTGITTPTATVSFLTGNNRADLDDPYGIPAKELAAIQIQAGSFCKQFALGHSYYSDTTPQYANGTADRRLKLDNVQEKSCDGSILAQPYTLTYYGQSGNPNFLPTRLSPAVDHWGYYNGATTNPASLSLNTPPTSLTYTPITGGNPVTIVYGTANRETNEVTLPWGTLSQLTYPTGGKTSFVYEANTAYGSRSATSAATLGSLSRYWPNGICPDDNQNPSATLTLTISPADLPNLYYSWQLKHTSDPTCTCSYGNPYAQIKVFSGTTLVGSAGGNGTCSSSAIQDLNGKLTDLLGNLPTNTPLRFEIYGARSASLFTVKNVTTTTVTDNYKVGGLRIKTLTSNDGLNSANDVIKSYAYTNPTGTPNAGQSSGKLYNQPLYGYVYDGCVGGCNPDNVTTGGCPTGSSRLRNAYFFEASVVPLGSFEGFHIGYDAVREYTAAGNTGTSTLYQYFNAPAIDFTGFPVAPLQPRISSGQLYNKGQFSSGGQAVVTESYSPKSETLQYGQGTYLKFGTYAIGLPTSGNTVTFWKRYTVATQPFRFESITRVQDGQPTVTNRQYNGVNHLQLTQESVTNSDGKLTVTDYKYPADLSGTISADQIAAFTNLNLLVPLQTTVTVAGTQRKGTKTEYAFFDTGSGSVSGGPTNSFIRPYKFYNWEGSSWILKGTLNAYHGTASSTGAPGLPSQFTKVGWQPENYQWTPAALLKQRQFQNFVWSYTYHPNTALVSQTIQPDGQSISYSYDALARLQQQNARGGNVVTNFTYSYPTLNGPGSIASRGYVKTSTTFSAVSWSGLATQQSYQYMDGLGRPLQTVFQGRAPLGTDQVRAVAYDNQGRVNRTYEAFANGGSAGAYQDPGSTPFTQTGYEDSPLNRVVSVTPPNWAATLSSYGTNSSGDAVLNYDYSTGNTSTFSASLLLKSTTTDGNGNKKIVFTDRKGRLLLSRRANAGENNRADTYYVYDDKDRLVRVIPPGASWSSANLTYGYSYFDNDLVSSKKLPGKGQESYTYNDRELPERFQDPFLANNSGRWLASQYDVYGRLTAKGVWNNGSSGSLSLQNKILENIYSTAPSGITVDKLSSRKVMVFSVADPVVTPGAANGIVQTSFSYDAYGRISGTTGNNHLNLGNFSAETTSYGYDFGDNIVAENRNSSGLSIANSRLYDSWGRLTQTAQSLNGASATLINRLDYTAKDQLNWKKLGNNLQQVDYTYLTNGLLSSINGTAPLTNSTQPVSQMLTNLNTPTFSATTEDLFRQELQYTSLTAGLGGSVQQSGNIGQVLWQVKGRTTQAYGFQYDFLDQLTQATSSEYTASGSLSASGYFNESQSFDIRGNLLTQNRNGLVLGSGNYGTNPGLDNRSQSQSDGTNQTFGSGGRTSVPLPSLALSVPHNYLNLPTSFSFNGGNSIELLYDGLGTKLRRTVRTGGTVSLTQDYLGGIELKNNAVEAVYNEEGRAYNTGSGYRYEYVLRDHLGNTRLVFTDKNGSGSIDNSEILSESHYYPFGRKMDGAWYSDAGAGKYRYLYNGKELSDEFSLNFYDYGARWYDPGLGSWWQLDPLSEVSRRWSPYVFSNNNPMRFVDPDGMLPGDSFDQWAQASNEQSARAEQQGLSAFSAVDGGNSQDGQVQAKGDPPGKGKNVQQNSSSKAATAASVAGGAVSLGVSAGTSTLGRILASIGRFFTTGAGLVTTLPLLVEGDITSSNEDEKPLTLYRGVHAGHPDYANAIKGKAVPWGINGGHQDPELHSGGNTKSIFTSWSMTKYEAQKNATANGPGGIVLERKFNITRDGVIPQTGAWFDYELEYLVPGIVTGAKVQILK